MDLLQKYALSVAFGLVGCSGSGGAIIPPPSGLGGSSSAEATGGASNDPGTGTGGIPQATGGATYRTTDANLGGTATGGTEATGGAGVGGSVTGGAATGGAATGGAVTGGTKATGGAGIGGSATGGIKATGGLGFGGFGFTTGGVASGGSKASGGSATSGGTTSASSSGPPDEVDCNAAMPTGGVLHSGNGQGGQGNLAWQIWSNVGSGNLTTFSTPAFSASWNNSGDYLGRLGFEWGNSGKTYEQYGTITAEFVFRKTGTGGPYSYVGMYGWSTNPCIEWYIVEDSYSAMPFNTGTAPSGTADIDGGTYNLVKRNTTGTGGNRCGNVTNWDQFYSIRTKGRQCGVTTVTKHFDAWKTKGWQLGNLLEVKILVEAGGGSGSVDFPIANVMKTQ